MSNYGEGPFLLQEPCKLFCIFLCRQLGTFFLKVIHGKQVGLVSTICDFASWQEVLRIDLIQALLAIPMHGGNYLNGVILASVHGPAIGLSINRVEVLVHLFGGLFCRPLSLEV